MSSLCACDIGYTRQQKLYTCVSEHAHFRAEIRYLLHVHSPEKMKWQGYISLHPRLKGKSFETRMGPLFCTLFHYSLPADLSEQFRVDYWNVLLFLYCTVHFLALCLGIAVTERCSWSYLWREEKLCRLGRRCGLILHRSVLLSFRQPCHTLWNMVALVGGWFNRGEIYLAIGQIFNGAL